MELDKSHKTFDNYMELKFFLSRAIGGKGGPGAQGLPLFDYSHQDKSLADVLRQVIREE